MPPSSPTKFSAVPLFERPADQDAQSPLAANVNRVVNIAPDGLGECPVWDSRTQSLYWIDIVNQTLSAAYLGSATPKSMPNSGASTAVGVAWLSSILPHVCRFVLPHDAIGFVAITEKPHVLCLGSNNGLFLFDTRVGKVVSRGADPEPLLARNRFNDGKVGPGGRLYAGTMQMKIMPNDIREKGSGKFYRIDAFANAKPQVVEAVGNTTVSNGLGWTNDDKHFFHVDTDNSILNKFDYDPATGEISNRRPLRDLETRLDGLCTDKDGHVWVAVLDKAEVQKLDKNTGETLAVVSVPGAKLVTSCAFGGPRNSLLFITTAAGTTADAITDTKKKDPMTLSGHLFVADVHSAGRPSIPFKLDALESSKTTDVKSKL
jgi:sugar lactone lactonase YvrE